MEWLRKASVFTWRYASDQLQPPLIQRQVRKYVSKQLVMLEVPKLQSWKIEEAVNGERQRKTDSNKDKTDIKKIKEVVQGTRMKNLVIKEDTNQRKESVFEK